MTSENHRIRFYVGAGDNYPQNLFIATKCDMKHCMTNSKHRNIGAKGASCGLQNTPKCVSGELRPGPPWGAHDSPPDSLISWGGGTPPHNPPYSAPRFPCFRRSPFINLGALPQIFSAPNIFLSNRSWSWICLLYTSPSPRD